MATLDSRYLLGLDDPACVDPRLVGAKAAVLAELARAGFAVPDALVLTAHAFAATGDGGALPEVVERAIIRAADHFGGVALAVRSSHLDEDLAETSRAGQYETVLGVIGADELRGAVERCWASGSAAVLIQRLLTPAVAGIAFTADPVTGDRSMVVLEAVAGLATEATAGSVDPERWEIRDGHPPQRRSGPSVLEATTVVRVGDLARQIADQRGDPQDIEWALDQSGLWLLQARPITALPEPAHGPVPVEVPPGFWERDASHVPFPHTPLNRSLLNPRRANALRKVFELAGVLLETLEFRDIGGWEYIRAVPLGDDDRPAPPPLLFGLLVRVVPSLRRRAVAARRAMARDLPLELVHRWSEEWRPELAARMSTLRDVDLPALTDAELDRHLEDVLGYVERAVDLHFLLHLSEAVTLFDLVETCGELLGWDELRACELLRGLSETSTAPARRLGSLTERVANNPQLQGILESNGDDVLARMEAEDPVFGELVTGFRQGDGFRGMRYEVAEPTLAERDELLLQLIHHQRSFDPAATDAAATEGREEARAGARAALAGRRGRDHDRFEEDLRRAEMTYPVREDNEFLTVGVAIALVRTVALEYGRRLTDRGQVAVVDDVFLLELDELRSALADGDERTALTARRRAERAWIESHPGPPTHGAPPCPPPSLRWVPKALRRINEAIMWSADRTFESERSGRRQAREGSRIDAIAASPGTYTGTVRLIHGEDEFDRLRVGDVCVCPVTSPVWSVLFPSMGALVTDAGGILSHPAIIAREHGIPAVVATGNATEVLHDGQLVTVDGSAGIVEVE